MKKIVLGLLFVFCCKAAIAATPTLTIDQDFNTKKEVRKYQILSQYSLGTGTGYTASDSGGTSTATGWITVNGIEKKTVGYVTTNTDTGTYTLRIEGKVGTSSNNAIFKIADITFGGTSSGCVNVVEYIDEMKISINKTGTTTGIVDLWSSLYLP